MKYTYKIPPSTTETTLTIDIPPATAIINQEAPVSSMSGGTPPVGTPPVDPPPSTGLTGYGTILANLKFDTLSPEQLGKGKVIEDPVKPGNKVFSAIVNKGDTAISQGWRSEQNWPVDAPTEGGVEFDINFISTYQNSLILQIHGNTAGTGGPVSIQMSGTNQLRVVLSDEKMNNQYFEIPNFTIQFKKWYHFRVEFKLANPGYFNVIIDGVSVLAITGKKVNDVKGQYGKIGINMFQNSGSGAPASVNILYDNLIVFKK